VFGEAIAILAGDALFALGFETLARQPGEASRVNAALRLMARAAGSDGLVGGEVEDVLAEGAPADPARLQFIHSRKTGALFAAACEIGALLGGGTDQQVASLREFGRCVGLAFQITDDLLNELSSVDALGKAAGSDRARSKATYPATHGIQAARDAANEAVANAKSEASWARNASVLAAFASFSVQRLR
jgi:geranylgeranyl diphosphate synthase type II